ncbi:MAG: gas vesicle protein GvpN [Rhizomicrobium sp.]|jgi:gas vesicle protein GvpN
MLNFTHSEEVGVVTTLELQPRAGFVHTQSVEAITKRALAYLKAGFSVHFRGPAGTGKTTLALHVAALLGRPTVMIAGDEDMATSTLVGMQQGYHYRKVVDRFIHTVTKMEETADKRWADHRLTTACREGYTLIYDEFTRSRPEANNVLLSVLEEGLLVLPAQNQDEPYIKVHPDFRVIFTSNPQEYAGVHDAQDALGDRIVTIDVGYADRDLEVAIAAARSGLAPARVAPIVDIVREFRETGEYDQTPTLRASIMICRIMAQEKLRSTIDDSQFVQVCIDILGSKSALPGKADGKHAQQHKMLLSLIEHHCPSRLTPAVAGRKRA